MRLTYEPEHKMLETFVAHGNETLLNQPLFRHSEPRLGAGMTWLAHHRTDRWLTAPADHNVGRSGIEPGRCGSSRRVAGRSGSRRPRLSPSTTTGAVTGSRSRGSIVSARFSWASGFVRSAS